MTLPELLPPGSPSTDLNAAVLVTLLVVAAGFDLKSRRIPNALVLAGLLSSLGFALLPGASRFSALSAWAGGLLVGFGLFLPLYLLHAMGAGDVKLMAMVGAFLGPLPALDAGLATLLAGGALALAVALYGGALHRTLANVRLLMLQTLFKVLPGARAQAEAPASAGHLPYAVAIAAGTLIHLLLVRGGYALFA